MWVGACRMGGVDGLPPSGKIGFDCWAILPRCKGLVAMLSVSQCGRPKPESQLMASPVRCGRRIHAQVIKCTCLQVGIALDGWWGYEWEWVVVMSAVVSTGWWGMWMDVSVAAILSAKGDFCSEKVLDVFGACGLKDGWFLGLATVSGAGCTAQRKCILNTTRSE